MVFKGQDAWRKHPLLANCSRTPFPVFGLAVKIFAAYVAVDCYVKFITAPPPDYYKPPRVYKQSVAHMDEMPRLKASDDDHH